MTTESKEVDKRKNQSTIRTSLALMRTVNAEKRTHLAELRTGIVILTVPMSLLTILIATSNYYSVSDVLVFIVGLVASAALLFLIGGYLVYSSLGKIRLDDRLRSKFDDLSCLVSEFNDDSNQD